MSVVEVKVCLLGDTGVGKTSLSNRFVQDLFSPTEMPTVGAAFQSKVIEMNGQFHKLLIWDAAGQDRFRTLAPLYYRGAHAIVLVYDLTRSETVEQVKYWVSEIRSHAPRDSFIIIVGNKCDRRHEQTVSKAVIDEYAEAIRGLHIEASAKTGENVSEIFLSILRSFSARASRISTTGTVMLSEKQRTEEQRKKSKCC